MNLTSRSALHRLLAGSTTVRRTKLALERTFGVHLLKELPHGTEAMLDVQRLLPKYRCEVVLDVGANVGQTVNSVKYWYPRTRMHCFEPSAENFRLLQQNVAGFEGVKCWQTALGAERGSAQLSVDGLHSMFRLADTATGQTERVDLDTLDDFMEREGIERVSYLKIDTEGHDLQVLQGGKRSLAAQRIDLVEVEAGMNPTNDHHVPLEQLKQLLEAVGYLLLGIYEQRHEWPTKRPVLRRCNAVFVSPTVVSDNTIT